MRSVRWFSIAALLFASTTIAQDVPPEQTQAGMNEASMKRLASAEADMARVLNALFARAKDDQGAITALRDAQSAWERYRDAQIAALWPLPERGGYGSVLPMCAADVRTELTETRIRELQSMSSASEGDVCASQWAR